jgi:hypothetical protein
MSQEPDLLTWKVLHRVMRDDAARLAKAIAGVDELDRGPRAAALGRWFAGYVGELHDHHTVEDEVFFPALVLRLPHSSALIDRVDADHLQLDDLLSRTSIALERLANPHISFRVALGEAVMVAEGLHALLDAHLGFEDDEILPLFARHFDATQFEALEQRAGKYMKLRQLRFTVPWVVEGVDELERRELFDRAPFMMKVVWYASRGQYRRLTAAAFEAPTLEVVA